MMHNLIPLAALGPRICIMGPSNSGKSTFAKAIADTTQFPVVHLDRLFHLPDTRWQARSQEAFFALHDEAIKGDCWIMEGNYHRCLKTRMARATGLIVLDVSLPRMLSRYFYRTLFQRDRVGGVLPENQRDRITGEMLKYLLFATPQKRTQLQKVFAKCDLPKLWLASPQQVHACYRAWSL